MSKRILSPLVLAALLTPACDWNTFGGEDDLAGGGCKEEVTVLAGLDAATALGFTAADVLAGAEGPHMSSMTWSSGLHDSIATVELGPESGDAQLTVDIHYAGGEIRLIKSTPEQGDQSLEFDPSSGCHDRLEIDVEVAVDSTGGGFAESFVAPLRASARGIATLRHSIEFADLQGSLALTKVEPADAKVGPVDLDIGVSPSGLFGSASAQVEIAVAGGVGATFMNVASWPSGTSACEIGFGEAPVALDDAIAGFSAADALALIAGAPALSLTWQGGQPTALTLELTHDGKPVCARYDGDAIGTLRFVADAAVKTADGRWDGHFPVEIAARPAADGSLASVGFSRYAPYAETVPAADFAATFGLTDIDLTGYDEGTIDFGGEYTPAGTAAGKLDVLGVKLPMCTNEPGQGCEGNTYDTLASATWSTP